jgi:hypothetical protein
LMPERVGPRCPVLPRPHVHAGSRRLRPLCRRCARQAWRAATGPTTTSERRADLTPLPP